jgi:hypothetical protein
MAKEPVKLVKAVVVRGSYWKVMPDGERVEILPGKGKLSEVEVTETQMEAFRGVLAKAEDAELELQQVAAESMQQITPTSDAVSPTAKRR